MLSLSYIFIALFGIAQLTRTASGSSIKHTSYKWKLARDNVVVSPGLTRTKTVINGQFPGPQIRVPYNSNVAVSLYNGLSSNGTAIHWHGIHQRGTPFQDGFAGHTQCPIPPHQTFDYKWVAGQSGSSFWHAHFFSELADGVYGPLIVEDAPGSFPFHYDEEVTILLGDVYDRTSWELVSTLNSPATSAGPNLDPTPNQGILCFYKLDMTHSCSSGTDGKGGAVTFKKGKTYRFRLIGASTLAPFVFSIDGHNMTLVKSDFETLKGDKHVSSLPIFTGERYDVLVTARNDVVSGSNFWIRAQMQTGCWPLMGQLNGDIRAVLSYDKPNATLPKTQGINVTNSCEDISSSLLAPLNVPHLDINPATYVVNYTLELNPATQTIVSRVNGSLYNGSTFATPPLSLYHQNPNRVPTEGLNELIIDGKVGKQVRVHLLGYGAPGSHQFHLHGHNFYVLATGTGQLDGNVQLNYVNPPSRDTLTVPAMGYAVIQFIADNPGVWALHCHVGWHLDEGMLARFVELPSEITKLKEPPQIRKQCQYWVDAGAH